MFLQSNRKKEGVRLVDTNPFESEKQRFYEITVGVFGSTFYADLVKVVVEADVITVALRPVSDSH